LPVRRLGFLILFSLAAAALPLAAQEPTEFVLDASPQLFSVLSAARAPGISARGSSSSSSVLSRVEESIGRLPSETVEPLRAFFEANQAASEPRDLSPFVSLALVLDSPPEFSLAVPEDHVPPDAYPLKDFPPVLAAFYEEARLGALWQQVQPFYRRAIEEQQAEVARLLLETRAYLRLIAGSRLGPTYTIYLEWLVPPALTSARNYGEDYYLVIHPQHKNLLRAVRHQYLHFLLDPVLVKYAQDVRPLARLQSVVEQAPRLPKAFQQDMLLLVTESLIRAVELRLQKPEPAAVAARLDEQERSGYLVVRHFYQALEGFEQDDPSMRYYFPELLQDYDLDGEMERLAALEFLAPAPTVEETAEAPVPQDPAARWLFEGQAFMEEGNYAAARERFEQILQTENSRHANALFGMALLASFEQDRQQAKYYFLLTLEEAQEPRILGWTHVYLGRIYDLEGEREQALSHYRTALGLDTQLPRLEQEARRGLERSFGEAKDPRPQEQRN
jgi:hypothetical protein